MENSFENADSVSDKVSKMKHKKSPLYGHFFNWKGLRSSLLVISLLTILQILHLLMQKVSETNLNSLINDIINSQDMNQNNDIFPTV